MNNIILDRIEGVFLEVFDDPSLKIGPQTSARDIQDWDSVAQVKLILAIEDLFGVQFDTEEVAEFECVGDVVAALERRRCLEA